MHQFQGMSHLRNSANPAETVSGQIVQTSAQVCVKIEQLTSEAKQQFFESLLFRHIEHNRTDLSCLTLWVSYRNIGLNPMSNSRPCWHFHDGFENVGPAGSKCTS